MPAPLTDPSILERVSKRAFYNPGFKKLSQYIGVGPSIRARARLALAAAFLVAVPMLLVAVLRSDHVFQHSHAMIEQEDYRRLLIQTRIALKNVDLALWAYVSEIDFDNGQGVFLASDELKQALVSLVKDKPKDIDLGPEGLLEALTARLDGMIRRALTSRSSFAPARLAMLTLDNELKSVENKIEFVASLERREALKSLSSVGRDLLVLLLILLFFIPIFVGLVPIWLVEPLSRLRQIAGKVELGKLKEMAVNGHDEVATLARTLKSTFLEKEELEQKKSSKIFEIRNILRSVLVRVREPIFIIDENERINYTNEAAAILLSIPSHQMEGKYLSDCMYSPGLNKASKRAFFGDVNEEAMRIHLEIANGRNYDLDAKIALVRNRDGEVSRVVIVLYASEILNLEPTKEILHEEDLINSW